MLREARREVPSLVLGPPSPSWMEPIVGSPPGSLKDSHEFWTTLPTPAEVPQSRARDLHHASATASQSEISSASRASTYPEATTASCESRKRSASPSCEISKTKTRTKPPSAKRRRIVPSGDATLAATPVDTWSTALSADTLSDTFLAPSSDMERDATEQFMNEFWGDLLLDASPASDDGALPALSDATPLPALPDCQLLDDVTEDQLLELAEFLGPELPQTADLELEPTTEPTAEPAAEPAHAPEPIEMLPMPHLPAPDTPEAPAPPTIDLAALLEETEIVFCPELEAPATSPPAPTPVPVPVTVAEAGATHYLLVVSPPERETATPATALSVASVASDSLDDAGFQTDGDDPEFLLDDQSTRWSSMSTEAEGDVEVYSVPSSGASRKRAPRRPPAATPAEKYRRIRDNNNEASRRSRQQRKQREVDTQARAEELEAENAKLHQRVTVLEGLLEQVKALAPLLTAKR